MRALLIVVDKKDRVLAYKTKRECHQGKGILHRAFSVFVFNSKGELLLQKRSQKKLLWPLTWSNTCCSHPIISRHPDPAVSSETAEEGSLQEIIKQAKKRLQEELGFSCLLKLIDKLYYQACYKNIGCEKEITYIFVGRYDGEVKPEKDEVTAIHWVSFDKLKEDFEKNPKIYTPWLKKIVNSKMLHC